MKKSLVIILSVLMSAFYCAVYAQSDISSIVIDGLKKGDASLFSSMMSQSVELSILGKGNLSIREHAIESINEFMHSHKVIDCKISHQGARESSSFLIVSLHASEGVSGTHEYRVYVFAKNIDNVSEIKQFRIDYVK